VKYLVDTNIFLEILLKQSKEKECTDFLHKNIDKIYISDFSLHSIGIILFHKNRHNLFKKFIADTLPKIEIITNPRDNYDMVNNNSEKYSLDFDDAYQFTLAKINDSKIKTMDKDFKHVKDEVEIEFLF